MSSLAGLLARPSNSTGEARFAVKQQRWSCQQEASAPALTRCLIQQSWYWEPQASLSPQYTQTAAAELRLTLSARAAAMPIHTAH